MMKLFNIWKVPVFVKVLHRSCCSLNIRWLYCRIISTLLWNPFPFPLILLWNENEQDVDTTLDWNSLFWLNASRPGSTLIFLSITFIIFHFLSITFSELEHHFMRVNTCNAGLNENLRVLICVFSHFCILDFNWSATSIWCVSLPP
jgi:hypothetical protein